MQVPNGVYMARKNDAGVHSVFIDEEVIELSVLGRRIAANRAKREGVEAEKRAKAAQLRTMQKKELEKRARNRRRIIRQELKLLSCAAVVGMGWYLGLVELAFAVPVLAMLQAVICFRAGNYHGHKDHRMK